MTAAELPAGRCGRGASHRAASLALGLTSIAGGLVLLAARANWIDGTFTELDSIWPLAVVGVGVYKFIALAERGWPLLRGFAAAWPWLFWGSVLLANQLRYLAWRRHWPLLLVGIGAGMVLNALSPRRPDVRRKKVSV
jgi:hypothetical protein